MASHICNNNMDLVAELYIVNLLELIFLEDESFLAVIWGVGWSSG